MKEILLILFYGIDVLLTYLTAVNYINLFPKKDVSQIESNPIVSNLWKKFGVHKGTILGIFITFPLMLFITVAIREQLFWFFSGAYTIIILGHLENLNTLRKLKNED